MDLKKQLMRVEIAGEQLEKASLMHTKSAAKKLGNETKALLSLLVDEINRLKSELRLID